MEGGQPGEEEIAAAAAAEEAREERETEAEAMTTNWGLKGLKYFSSLFRFKELVRSAKFG